jgi:hypothetical protein
MVAGGPETRVPDLDEALAEVAQSAAENRLVGMARPTDTTNCSRRDLPEVPEETSEVSTISRTLVTEVLRGPLRRVSDSKTGHSTVESFC